MDEPIAIIGLDARLPSDGGSAEGFFDSLVAGKSARREVPSDRFNVDAFWHPDKDRSGSTAARFGHFLSGSISAFDAPFFSTTPAEAHGMDPQQRGMLECAYKALENAGIPLEAAAGTQTGVYVGCFTADYNDITVKDLDVPSKYAATGTVASMLSNRISWFFDFHGPSITVDTACSSSLVAVHEACMSLRLREISMAIAGGCNLILTPEMTLKLDAAGVLGPDGKSQSFDHKGNGYARGEGFGAVILKRVSDAVRDGDMIRAIIRNSSTNQDGRSPGIAQPTKAGQARLINHVYSRAGLDPGLTRFIEAHGTGTAVGDPIEASAISSVFSPYRSAEEPLFVGAVKSNVGHLEGAAGIAAVIKGVFALERGIIPPNIWFDKANPRINSSWNLKFPTEATVWPQPGLRRMSINSFGIGGSNAHVVMDDALHFLEQHNLVGSHRTVLVPVLREPLVSCLTNGVNGHHKSRTSDNDHATVNGINHDRPRLYLWSAQDRDGIDRVLKAYNAYLIRKSKDSIGEQNSMLRDLAYTLANRRTQLLWRTFHVATNLESLQTSLKTKLTPVKMKSQPRLAFIFTGQGAQWPEMGMQLMQYPVFRHSILGADAYLASLLCPWSLTYELSKGAQISRINDPELSQPLCTALQVAIVDLLYSWNILPGAVAGHSSGEVAAAYAVGAISREAAWKISYYRGKVSGKVSRSGAHPGTGMAAVGLSLEETQACIDKIIQTDGQGTLEVACMNSWNSHTVSGDSNRIDALIQMLDADGIFARRLNVDTAYHSQYMRAVGGEYLHLLGEIQTGEPSSAGARASFYSSTYGSIIPASKLREAAYWVENLVSPVQFCSSVTALLKGSRETPQVNGHTHCTVRPLPVTDILEIGPHSALKAPLHNIIKSQRAATPQYHCVLKRHCSAIETLLFAAGSLYCHGHPVNISEINNVPSDDQQRGALLIDLPSYPFNHSKEYWRESRISRNYRFRPVGRHELLGSPVPDWNRENAIWRNYIRLSESPWLEHHKVSGEVLYPAASMLVMAIEASRQLADQTKTLKAFKLKEVSFHKSLPVKEDDEGIESHFCLRPSRQSRFSEAAPWSEFQLFTWQADQWIEHCYGLIQVEYQPDSFSSHESIDTWSLQSHFDALMREIEDSCMIHISSEDIYRKLRASGLDFGQSFQTLGKVRLGPDHRLVGTVTSPVPKLRDAMPSHYTQPHLLHPSTLDGVVHSNLVSLAAESHQPPPTRVPVYADEIWVSADPNDTHSSYSVAAHAQLQGPVNLSSSVIATDSETGKPMVYASGLIFKTLMQEHTASNQDTFRGSAFNIEWKPDPDLLNELELVDAFGLSTTQNDNPSVWMEDCEKLCLLYLQRFVTTVTPDRIERMGAHHRKYLDWMRHQCRNAHTSEANDSLINDLEKRVKSRGTPEGRLIVAVGQALTDILGGTLDPLDVLFKDKIADDVYGLGLGSQKCYPQLRNYIDALAHKNPAMNILEVGAGTGGATSAVMKTLTGQGPRLRQYDFTDISPSFFERAKEKFNEQSGKMSFKVLNIEKDPIEQGFEPGYYDLVVAANVLHATKQIDVSLSNARKLLKPGGKLLLFEVTNLEILLVSFCFGVFPGWWLSEDKDRVWGPLMSPEGWRGHLYNAGFAGLDVHLDDFPGCPYRISSILISTVPLPAPKCDMQLPLRIIFDAASSSQHSIVETISQTINLCGFSIVESLETDMPGATCLVLWELDASLLTDMTQEVFDAIKHITKCCQKILWLTRDTPHGEMVVGMARAARLERPELQFITVLFDQEASPHVIAQKATEILGGAKNIQGHEFKVSKGCIHIPRLIGADYLNKHIAQAGNVGVVNRLFRDEKGHPMACQIGIPGSFDTLRFEADLLASDSLRDDEVEFEVMACGISGRDVAALRGELDGGAICLEASGVVTQTGSKCQLKVGDKVFGLTPSGSLKTKARSSEAFLAKMREAMSWEEAASMPVAYTTAFGLLHENCGIKPGDSILFLSCKGSVNLAAIHLAQIRGAQVLAAVGSVAERDFLVKAFNLPREQIFSTNSFAVKMGVRHKTRGRGVDLILSAGPSDTLTEVLDCVVRFGRIFELDSRPANQSSVSIGNIHHDVKFEKFDLLGRILHDPAKTGQLFKRAVEYLSTLADISSKTYPRKVYSFSQIQDAFHALQKQDSVGAIVLRSHSDDTIPVLHIQKPTCEFDADASYVISGGLGGLGKSVARWMVSRGARNLILLSRSGASQQSARDFIDELKISCKKVAAPVCDVTVKESLRSVIAECMNHMPAIKGCVQGSMVLKDNRMEHMTVTEWNETVSSKVAASLNLVDVLGRDMDFFVFLSSNVGITGNLEQANYSAGNTFQDALARHIASEGINAVSLDLPVIKDVGFVADKPELFDYMISTGWAFMEKDEFHAVLSYYCNPSRTPRPLLHSQAIPRLWHPQDSVAEGYNPLSWIDDPMFSHLVQSDCASIKETAAEKEVDHAKLLVAATDFDAAEQIVLEALLLKISRVLSVDISNLDAAKPLHAFGIDSLVAVELRSWLRKQIRAEISVFDIVNKASILLLAKTAAEKSELIA